jgi:beta-lactamase regulating signal transducer with metallopeptidase domain
MKFPTILEGLPWLAVTSLQLGALIVILLFLRRWLRGWIGSRWVCALWILILARMLFPWPIPSAVGIVERPPHHSAGVAGDDNAKQVRAVLHGMAEERSEIPSPSRKAAWRPTWRDLWLSGALLGMAVLASREVRVGRLRRSTRQASDPRLLAIFESLPWELRRGVELREIDGAMAPALAGVWRPQIWWPRAWTPRLNDEAIRHILLHETGHARRGDLIVEWLFALAVCLHWFNPFAWAAARSARSDREIACDRWVLARCGNGDVSAYGNTLLRSLAVFRDARAIAPAAVAMAANRGSLRERIVSLAANEPRTAWRGAALVMLVGLILAATTTHRVPGQESAPAAPAAAGEKAGGPFEIEAMFIELSESDAKRLAAAYPSFADAIVSSSPRATLLAAGDHQAIVASLATNDMKSDILSAPKVTVREGQSAAIEIVREFRYPVEFEKKENPDGSPPEMEPVKFETEKVGVTLSAKVRNLWDGTLELDAQPKIVEFLGLDRFKDGKLIRRYTDSKTTTEPGWIERPVFSTRTTQVKTAIPTGHSVMLSGMPRDENVMIESDGVQRVEKIRRMLLLFIKVSPVR